MGVSIQQAAANAAVAYLQDKMSGVPIHSRWPAKEFPGRSITLIFAGARRDQLLDPHMVSRANYGDYHTRATWVVAECTQPFQLDVWSTSFLERDSIVADLDIYLRAGREPLGTFTSFDPVANGFFVALGDGWEESGATADFSFEAPELEDYPDSVGRSQFRASYRGVAHMKLSVQVTSPRQRQIILTSLLNGVEPRENTTIDTEV